MPGPVTVGTAAAVRARLVDNRLAAALAMVGGGLAAAGANLTWVRISVEGRSGPGSLATGLDGRDGRTVMVVGLLAVLLGLVLLAGRGDGWLKAGLWITGGITTVIAIVDIADVGAKANLLEKRFGIPTDSVAANVGIGLWLVAIGGVAMLVAGLVARRGGGGPGP